jgi:multicomponent Na+:H+ antiporter subunit F
MAMAAALVLLLGAIAPALFATWRGEPLERLVSLEVLSVVATVVLLLLAVAYDRSAYVDVALVVALLSFTGALVFARFFGRSL